MTPHETEAAVRGWAAERHLPELWLERWLNIPAPDRGALYDVAVELRFRTGQFVAIFEMLNEIGVREHCSIKEILARPEVERIVHGPGSSPQRARLFTEHLKAIRFPHLNRRSELIREKIAALRLPRGIRLSLPTDLSSDELTIAITVHSAAELEGLVNAMRANMEAIKTVVEMVGSGNEV
jgi:hypothetical protein